MKSILNTGRVSLTNCDQEPIHVPGSIQEHGFLIAVSGDDFIAEFCSANTKRYFGISPADVLGKSFEDLFGKSSVDALLAHTRSAAKDRQPFRLTTSVDVYHIHAHQSGKYWIIEGELLSEGGESMPDLYAQTGHFVAALQQSKSLAALCGEVAAETRRITGYDRVMIYRFDESYNGEVIAENKRADLESFYGQHYPHTDIPAQARELYLRNFLRMIADVGYTPVPLLAFSDRETNSSLDLTHSNLRSISPVHIEYLKNMGVGATLTVSLVLEEKLWGLIACHHYSPLRLPHFTRLAALLQGHFLTSQIRVRETAEEFEHARKADENLADLLPLLYTSADFVSEHSDSPQIKRLAAADGVIIRRDDKIFTEGVVPVKEDCFLLTDLLFEESPMISYRTESVAADFPAAAHITAAAGVLHHPFGTDGKDSITWVRGEFVETINWAGKPYNKSISAQPLTPRKSFELWKEERRRHSLPWKKSDVSAAANFAYVLEKHNGLRLSRQREDRYRKLSDELKAANRELANMNWISTHDLKEPLRKIRLFASMLLEEENNSFTDKTKKYLGRMGAAAERMQSLIEDILSYSQTENMEKVFELADLTVLLRECLEDRDLFAERIPQVNFDQLPALKIIPFQVKQLFVNLLSNAAKFTPADVIPRIDISTRKVSGSDTGFAKADAGAHYWLVSVKDNGIGFEESYAEKIFEVFYRLHGKDEYPGTGIGLAICRKIMENHSGFIKAVSSPDAGTTMMLFFPENPAPQSLKLNNIE